MRREEVGWKSDNIVIYLALKLRKYYVCVKKSFEDLINFFMASSFTQAFGVYSIDLLPLKIRSEAQKRLRYILIRIIVIISYFMS